MAIVTITIQDTGDETVNVQAAFTNDEGVAEAIGDLNNASTAQLYGIVALDAMTNAAESSTLSDGETGRVLAQDGVPVADIERFENEGGASA